MKFDSNDLPDGSEYDYDLCIIGGGAAGLVLANELRGAPLRVAVLESGGEVFDASTQELYAGEVFDSSVKHSNLLECRQRTLGGSSERWGGWCLPLEPFDFSKREDMDLPHWPISYETDYRPYLQKACEYLDLGENNFSLDSIDEDPDFLKSRVDSFSLNRRYIKYSSPTQIWNKYNQRLTDSDNIHVYMWANVTHLEINNSTSNISWVSVKTLKGKSFKFKAKKFVLAAGGFESVRLLLNSNNIREDGVGNAYGHVGKNYHSHPIFENLFSLVYKKDYISGQRVNKEGVTIERGLIIDDKVKEAKNLLNTFFWSAKGSASALKSGSSSLKATEALTAYSFAVSMEMRPSAKSFVKLAEERDILGLKKIQVHFELLPEDIQSLILSTDILAHELSKINFGRFQFSHNINDVVESQRVVRYHHMGTTIMGHDEKTSVVGSNLKVHGTNNLYIAGCSVFPTGGYANPMLSIMALTVRLADHIKGSL